MAAELSTSMKIVCIGRSCLANTLLAGTVTRRPARRPIRSVRCWSGHHSQDYREAAGRDSWDYADAGDRVVHFADGGAAGVESTSTTLGRPESEEITFCAP